MSTSLPRIVVSGTVGLLVWEIWSRALAGAFLGFPLEAEAVVAALVHHTIGVALSDDHALLALYASAVALGPLAYARIAERGPSHGMMLDIAAIIATTASLELHSGINVGLGSGLTVWLCMAALVATRWINPFPPMADAISWGICMAALLLGVLAPLAGLSPFQLSEGLPTALMSVAGCVIYGATSAMLLVCWQPRMDGAALVDPGQDRVLASAAGSFEHV